LVWKYGRSKNDLFFEMSTCTIDESNDFVLGMISKMTQDPKMKLKWLRAQQKKGLLATI